MPRYSLTSSVLYIRWRSYTCTSCHTIRRSFGRTTNFKIWPNRHWGEEYSDPSYYSRERRSMNQSTWHCSCTRRDADIGRTGNHVGGSTAHSTEWDRKSWTAAIRKCNERLIAILRDRAGRTTFLNEIPTDFWSLKKVFLQQLYYTVSSIIGR